MSETGIYLNVATTALLVALVEAGEQPGEAVRLADPVAALRTFAEDPTCRSEARLTRGGTASALAIQRHYLECTERALKKGRLPTWAPEVCARWRALLDRLEQGPAAAAGTLDWATKLTVYADHARERGFSWDALAFWTGVTEALDLAITRADVKALSCEPALDPNGPIRDDVAALTPSVTQRRETWAHLRKFIDLRQEFYALDTRWGEMGEPGVWASLDRAGSLSHRIVTAADVEKAVTTPPLLGRARLRGQIIQAASANGSLVHSGWDRMVDKRGNRYLDLSDPFAAEFNWHPLGSTSETGCRSWVELLHSEPRFALEHPLPFQELVGLAQVLELHGPGARAVPLMRRALSLLESSFRPDHPILAAGLRDLAQLPTGGVRAREALGMTSRARAIEKLNSVRRDEGPEHPAVALACNELAVCLRSQGLASQAELVLREAVAIEDRIFPPDHPKRPHRLNNLASVLLMQDKREETHGLLTRAWQQKDGRHDLTSARILCLRLALEWIEGRDGTPFLGQMKTLLAEAHLGTQLDIATTWEVAAVWESLRPRLSEARLILLQRIAASLNDRTLTAQLVEFPEWRDVPTVPLDAPWPESAPVPQP